MRAVWAAILAALLTPAAARAYSDPTLFAQATLAAGGGGRFFTGSPADGYTCKVCHAGGSEPKLNITGLPLGGYRPGIGYEVVISWPAELEKMSLALELTDDKGKRVGSVQLPPQEELQNPELCDPPSAGIAAAALTESEGRQVINMPDCGAKRVRFLWVAPTTDVGRVWFSGSAVHSDGEGDPYHDGVTDFGRTIDSPAVASTTSAQCSVTAPGARRGSVLVLSAMLVLLGYLRRRQQGPRLATSTPARVARQKFM